MLCLMCYCVTIKMTKKNILKNCSSLLFISLIVVYELLVTLSYGVSADFSIWGEKDFLHNRFNAVCFVSCDCLCKVCQKAITLENTENGELTNCMVFSLVL